MPSAAVLQHAGLHVSVNAADLLEIERRLQCQADSWHRHKSTLGLTRVSREPQQSIYVQSIYVLHAATQALTTVASAGCAACCARLLICLHLRFPTRNQGPLACYATAACQAARLDTQRPTPCLVDKVEGVHVVEGPAMYRNKGDLSTGHHCKQRLQPLTTRRKRTTSLLPWW
jgi:hypothetical protein